MGMLTDRMASLLREAAKAMNEGMDPFSHDFLLTHQVTLEECYSLGTTMAVIVHGFLNSIQPMQTSILIGGAMEDWQEAQRVAETVLVNGLAEYFRKQISELKLPGEKANG